MHININNETLYLKKRDKLLDMLLGINTYKEIKLSELENQPTIIRDLMDLATAINVEYSQLLNCVTHINDYQIKLLVGDNRVVYKSKQPLSKAQQYLESILTKIYKQLDCTHLLAYINGHSYINKIKERKGTYDVLVSLDIRKYFDSISREHINMLLTNILGFNRSVSNMYSKIATVKGEHPIFKYKGGFLQQGSTASPVLSNLIGYFFYDLDIKALLDKTAKLLDKKEGSSVEIEYFRYCDNLYIGIKNSIDIPKIKILVDNIKEIMKKSGFIVHKDRIITRTNPHIAQQILGITINNIPKIGDKQFSNKKAQLVNIITGGLTNIENNLVHLYDNNESTVVDRGNPLYKSGKVIIAKQILQGELNYYKSVNEEQGSIIAPLVDIIATLYDKYRQSMESVDMNEYIRYLDIDSTRYIRFISNKGIDVSIFNDTSRRQQYIDSLFNNTLMNTNIIKINELDNNKFSYIINKVSELFNVSNYVYNVTDNAMLNFYIPVNRSNHKKLSSSIYKVINNHRTNGILLNNIIPYGTFNDNTYVDIPEENKDYIDNVINASSQLVTINGCIYKVLGNENTSVYNTLMLRLPIYYDNISEKINTLHKGNIQENVNNLVNTIIGGDSVIINIVFIPLDDCNVKQSNYQRDRAIRHLYNKSDIDTIINNNSSNIISSIPYEDIYEMSIGNLFK